MDTGTDFRPAREPVPMAGVLWTAIMSQKDKKECA